MRHASIQTTMNVYGRAMPQTKREANRAAASQPRAGPFGSSGIPKRAVSGTWIACGKNICRREYGTAPTRINYAPLRRSCASVPGWRAFDGQPAEDERSRGKADLLMLRLTAHANAIDGFGLAEAPGTHLRRQARQLRNLGRTLEPATAFRIPAGREWDAAYECTSAQAERATRSRKADRNAPTPTARIATISARLPAG